jgi:hypothetical protein
MHGVLLRIVVGLGITFNDTQMGNALGLELARFRKTNAVSGCANDGAFGESDCQQLIVKAYRLFWLRLCRAMKDRAQHALHLLALDPAVETTADHNSYGFRPQRSCADAIKQCFKTLSKSNPQWILEGDIKSCFDRISHDWLLAHVPMDRAILQSG